MNAGLIIYGFALCAGPAIAFCETRQAALCGAHAHRAELLADSEFARGDRFFVLPPTPIYRITVRPFDVTMALDLLNNPEIHVTRMLQSVETIAFVSTGEAQTQTLHHVSAPKT